MEARALMSYGNARHASCYKQVPSQRTQIAKYKCSNCRRGRNTLNGSWDCDFLPAPANYHEKHPKYSNVNVLMKCWDYSRSEQYHFLF